MKQSVLYLFCILYHSIGFGQQNIPDTIPLLTKTQLLSKAKVQKTTGWIIVGTGAPVVAFTGFCVATIGKDDMDTELATEVLVASAIYTSIGILLLRAAKINKNKALSIGFINQRVVTPQLNTARNLNNPAISLTINL